MTDQIARICLAFSILQFHVLSVRYFHVLHFTRPDCVAVGNCELHSAYSDLEVLRLKRRCWKRRNVRIHTIDWRRVFFLCRWTSRPLSALSTTASFSIAFLAVLASVLRLPLFCSAAVSVTDENLYVTVCCLTSWMSVRRSTGELPSLLLGLYPYNTR